MKIKASVDGDGFVSGFYLTGSALPVDTIMVEVAPDLHARLCESPQSMRYVDGSWVDYVMPPAPPVIPQTISRFQARAALLAAGLLSDVEAAVAAADPFAQLAWAEAQEWRRDSPTLLALANGIGLTDAEIDDLFIQAAAIRA